MKNRLTKKEKDLMEVVKNEWIDRAIRKPIKTNEKAARELINYGYKLAGLKNPMVIFVDSPMGVQIGTEYVVKLLEALKITKKEPAQVWAQVWDQVRDQVWDQVGDQVWDQVRDQVRDQVGDQVWDQNFYRTPSYNFDLWDFNWTAFYDFFTRIKVINNKPFNKWLKLIKKAGIFYSIQLDGLCVVSRMPIKVNRNQRNVLHSEDGPAIEFLDSYCLYALEGVRLPEGLYKKIIDQKLTFRGVMRLDNAEQRMIALKYMGVDKMLKGVKAKLIHKSERGNQLWEIDNKEVFPQAERFVRLVCPSTGRIYLEGVTPSNTDNADTAVAWQLFLTKKQYMALEVET